MRKTEEEIVGGLSGKGRRLINSHIFVENCMKFGQYVKKTLMPHKVRRRKMVKLNFNENDDQNHKLWASVKKSKHRMGYQAISMAGVLIMFTGGTGGSYHRR